MTNRVTIKFKNVTPYQIIRKLHELNIAFSDIKDNQDDVYLNINYSDYLKIQKKMNYYDMEIIDYCGLSKLQKTINNYYVIIIGIILSFFMIVMASNIVVEVVVIHENEELKQMIIDELYEYGIRKFSFKKNYRQIMDIKKKIKNNHLDKIEWIEIRKSGMRYIVNIEERVINNIERKKEYCHVIASKDGRIKRINVYDGEGVVSFNDYVRKGDILIRGDVKLNENVVSHNCASGDVYAEVWYNVNVKIPLQYYVKKRTGKNRYNIIVNYNGIDYQLFRDRLTEYEFSKEKKWDLLGIKIYLKTDYEIKKIAYHYSEEEAIDKGLLLAQEKVLLKLKKGDEIIDEKILQKRLIDSTMDIDIFIIAEEYIGQVVETKEEDRNDL